MTNPTPINYPDTWKNDKKLAEQRCLNAAKKDIKWLRSLKDISLINQERPDFILLDSNGERIGLEHFMVDISMGNQKNSRSKIMNSATRKIHEKYHGAFLAEKARDDIQDMLNEALKDWQNFDHETFCKNFSRVMQEHINQVDDYRKNAQPDKLGFMIEVFVPNSVYKVSINGEPLHQQELNNFPITKSMWELLSSLFDYADFIIIVTNQYARQKDFAYMLERGCMPKLYNSFATPLQGEKGTVKINLI